MRSGTFNNLTRWSKEWGGSRKCFESQPTILPGGFKFELADLPGKGNVLPAGSPVFCDEVARTITPLYLFQVTKVEADTKKVSVAKDMEGTRAKVGMSLIVLGNDLTQPASTSWKVVEVDSSDSQVDVLTLDAAITGITAASVLAEASDEKKVKVTPNAITPYDTCVDEDAFACDGDGAWAVYHTPVLERRIPVIPEVIKDALKKAGCIFRFSNRK